MASLRALLKLQPSLGKDKIVEMEKAPPPPRPLPLISLLGTLRD